MTAQNQNFNEICDKAYEAVWSLKYINVCNKTVQHEASR